MPKVSIIIVNYQGWQETINCLKGLAKLDYPNFDIVIVENNSPNSSFQKLSDFLKKAKHKKAPLRVQLIKSKRNLGFAGGCNLGIKETEKNGADYFLLLNPDTIVTKNFLGALIQTAQNPEKYETIKKAIRQGKKIGFLGPRILYQDKKTVYSNGGIINKTFTSAILKDHGKAQDELKEKEPFLTDYVTGTALLVHKEVLDDVGLMDEDYFLYYEDSDWALRAKKQGYFHLIVPSSIIFHQGYHATGYLSFNYIYYLTRNGYYLAWKNGKFWQRIFVVLYSFYKLIKQPMKIFLPAKRKWVIPIITATWDFWRGKIGKY